MLRSLIFLVYLISKKTPVTCACLQSFAAASIVSSLIYNSAKKWQTGYSHSIQGDCFIVIFLEDTRFSSKVGWIWNLGCWLYQLNLCIFTLWVKKSHEAYVASVLREQETFVIRMKCSLSSSGLLNNLKLITQNQFSWAFAFWSQLLKYVFLIF
jgi:hypothetical protein